MRDIKANEEITINYGMIGYEYGEEISETGRMCRCGADTCKGVWGCYKEFTDEDKIRYAGYISDYLLQSRG